MDTSQFLTNITSLQVFKLFLLELILELYYVFKILLIVLRLKNSLQKKKEFPPYMIYINLYRMHKYTCTIYQFIN